MKLGIGKIQRNIFILLFQLAIALEQGEKFVQS